MTAQIHIVKNTGNLKGCKGAAKYVFVKFVIFWLANTEYLDILDI